jgi:hypothetical protein
MAKKESFLIRTDPAVLDALRRWAADDLRSANAQIEFLLRRALQDAGRLRREAPETNAGGSVVRDTRPGGEPPRDPPSGAG